MTELEQSPASAQSPDVPVLIRSASVTGVNFIERIIEFIATPYDEEAVVEWRGQAWREVFCRGAWDGIEKRQNWVKANREHDKKLTVGKIIQWEPRQDALVGEAKIAETALGNDTLALAAEQCLGASVGYKALPHDVQLDKMNRVRRVKRAFMDHLSFVADPAYAGASVLSVRGQPQSVVDLGPLAATPALDDLVSWMQTRKG